MIALTPAERLFLDAKGRMRIDMKLAYKEKQVSARVKVVHEMRVQWVYAESWPISTCDFTTRAERRRVLTVYADMVSMHFGHDYRLRSKL